MEGRSVRIGIGEVGRDGVLKKPSSTSGNADREAVWLEGWDMDSH